MSPTSGPGWYLSHDERLGMGFLIGIPLGLWVLGALLPPAPDTVGVVARLILVAVSIVLGLRLLRGATALAFGLASLVTLLLFHLPLGLYTQRLAQQAGDLTVFLIVLFGAVLFLLGRQDLLDRQARRVQPAGTDDASEEERRLDQEVAVLCVLPQFLGWVRARTDSRLWRGLSLSLLALINFVSSVTAALLFKSLWAPTRTDFTNDVAGRVQAAGILCLCTTGVLVASVAPVVSTWWLFFSEMAGTAWMPTRPLGVWLYGLLSFAHGYWLLTRDGEPAPTHGRAEHRLDRLYRRLLVGALASVALVFYVVPWVFPAQAPTQVAAQGQTAAPHRTTAPTSTAALSTGAPAATPPSAHGPAGECAEKQDRPPRDRIRLAVCTLLLGLAAALLMAQGWLYRFHLPAASERWGAGGFWDLLLAGMHSVFTTVVLLVVILAFKDLVLGAIGPAPGDTTAPVGGPYQVPFALLASAVTLAAGAALGSAWGACALGVMVLQTGGVAPHPALTQTLILIAAFCNQRSPRADNVLNLLGGKYATGPNVTALWSVTSFTLPLPGRRVPVQAEWVQAALVLLGVLVAWEQAVG